MGNVYEIDGQLFTNVGEFLDALAHEYKTGDADLAVQTLEDYGFTLSDINVVPNHPHLLHPPSEPLDNAENDTPRAA